MNREYHASCPACCGPLEPALAGIRDADSGEDFSVATCAKCGLGKTLPVPQDLGRYYSAAYYGNRHGFTRQYCNQRRLRWINRFTPVTTQRRLLDIGCGDGSFIEAAQNDRWQVTGVERAPDFARSLGLSVYESLDSITDMFDCVTLWHVLEHIEDATELFMSLDRVLARGGSIFIAVPDFQSLQARVFGRHWLHLDVPRHVIHFSEMALDQLCAKDGYWAQRLRTSELEYDLMGWTQSLLNLFSRRPNLLLKILTQRQLEIGWFERVTHIASGAALCSLAILPTWLSGCWGRGGTIVMRIQRNEAGT